MSWGPPTWMFLHCLAQQIDETKYLFVKDSLWSHIKELCSNLPCPDCSAHAISYLARIPTPPNKQYFIQAMYAFHNAVNQNIGKPPFPIEGLQQYKRMHPPQLFLLYKKAVLTQPYNPKLMMNKMRTKQFVQKFERWLQQYY